MCCAGLVAPWESSSSLSPTSPCSSVDDDGVALTRFPYAELMRAINNFDTHRKLGQGGFGVVYRRVLQDIETFSSYPSGLRLVGNGSRFRLLVGNW
ncbi:hypothetical protein Taro_027356 [Colocasia esculenta]|uniref:Uncharacterized protein n=1 Tax=Colocasia esculenta TaxID=4460 RepID=A0A843VNH0_COLES|nr:hypothetical protein [Colocasia esculenta]